MIVYVLTENEPYEGGSPVGVYSTPEKAKEAAATKPLDWGFYKVVAIEIDAPLADHYDDTTPLDR